MGTIVTESTRRGPKNGGSMLSRGLALLGAFRSIELELSQTELARRTGLPKPTVHRLVAELTECGALERTRGGVRLGQWLYLIGARVPRVTLLRTISQPYLDRLHELTREHVCLSVHGGDEALDIAWSGGASWRETETGAHLGTVSSSAMRALRAKNPDEGPFIGRAEVGGHATTCIPSPRAAGPLRVVALAAPVWVFGEPVAAVSLVGPVDRFDVGAVGAHLRSTTGMLARKLALTSLFCE